ncbi:MAG: pyruvate synthase [Candidatus Altiarchaeales archaeon HGW-Altiarchaeales-3]|nr:MAG: pyruvate synthase [Candidatus Altiarchaeales archaeon HGW-Altiarchaeales-3]
MKYTVGAVITEPGNSKITKTGAWRTFKPIVDNEKCVKCGICEKVCPEGSITIGDTAEIDYDYCKGCGICANECPKGAIKMIIEEK